MTLSDQPPPLPTEDQWYYAESGIQKGPIAASALRALLSSKTIDAETLVWRTGWRDWKPVRETDLRVAVQDIPPPLGPQLVRNTAVWIVALLPLAFGIIDASIAYENRLTFGLPAKEPIPDIPPGLYAVITLGFCLWDRHVLRKAGYQFSGWFFLTALITPVYLFLRAKRIKQRPTYAITWVCTFIVAVLLMAAAQ